MPRSERAIPLLGRGSELAELVGHISAAARGQLRLALVQGEPGTGKSRLLDEARSHLTARGFSVMGHARDGRPVCAPAFKTGPGWPNSWVT
jgi:AAA ATPase domain